MRRVAVVIPLLLLGFATIAWQNERGKPKPGTSRPVTSSPAKEASPPLRREPAKGSGIPACGTVDGLGLTAFVGQKIFLKEVPPPPNTRVFNSHYRARYKIRQLICGDEVGSEIEFDVYNHYGSPKFAEHDTVLLYVSRYKKGYIHQKYISNRLYLATDGSWAGCGDPYLFARTPKGTIETTRIELVEPLTFSVADYSDEYISEHYSSEYYVRDGDKMTCKTGAPVEQVYAIERLGMLKAREDLGRP